MSERDEFFERSFCGRQIENKTRILSFEMCVHGRVSSPTVQVEGEVDIK